jgi:hypothetical protein
LRGERWTLPLFDFEGTITTKGTYLGFVSFVRPRRKLVGGIILSPVIIGYGARLVSDQAIRKAISRVGFWGEEPNPLRRLGRANMVSRLGCGVVLTVVAGLGGLSPSLGAHLSPGGPPTSGVCERESLKVAGRKAVGVGRKIRAPKKIHDVRPEYPKVPPKTRHRAATTWAGELLVDPEGKVSHVWTIREVKFTPPFPAFNNAIVDAVRQWKFTPTLIDGTAVPICIALSVTIDWG